ncbi:MAG: DUF2079 domain-containing protein, partial [Candidatus Aureabacteria bacterium]|nr:DUF2079 domain-containing protein [Candidatus Auribacterota bacterium]
MKKCDTPASALILLYIAAFAILCFRLYRSFGYHDFDLATANQIMWNNLHGNPFYSSLHGGNILGFHAYLIFFLLSPIYALWQSPLMLLCLHTVFLGLAGWPIYLLARDELKDRSAALVFLSAYLLYPPLGYINSLHVHSVNFAPFFLAFAYWFYRKSRYAPFLISLGIAMSAREEISFIAVAFAVSALWEKRRWQWWIIPLAAGVAWFSCYFFWLSPFIRGGMQSPYLAFYAEAGGSSGRILHNIFMHPLLITNIIFKPYKLCYLFYLFAPLAFMPLLSPGILFLCLPNLFLNLLATNPNVATIVYHYNCPLIPFIFIAGVMGFARLRTLLRIRAARVLTASALMVTAITVSWRLGPQLHLFSNSWKGVIDCLPKSDFMTPAKWEMVKAVPPHVPAATNFGFFTMLSSRKELDSIPWVLVGRFGDLPCPYPGRSDIESALIDFGDPTTFIRYYNPTESPARFREYLARNHLGLIKLYDQIALYKRGVPDTVTLWERLAPGEKEKREKDVFATFDGLRLVGAEIEPVGTSLMRQLRFTSLWEATGRVREDVSLIVRIQGPDNRTLL